MMARLSERQKLTQKDSLLLDQKSMDVQRKYIRHYASDCTDKATMHMSAGKEHSVWASTKEV